MKQIIAPYLRFFKLESSSSILLFLSAIIALVLANSPWASFYFDFWQTKLGVRAGGFSLEKPLILWINDGLMAIFFFLIGLEIKREILVGELSTVKGASLPIFAAIGGMIIPILAFKFLHGNQPGAEGWGIPMATDIAFSLGILKLLGSRIPNSIKVLLAAFAIVDDIGAVLVIALFYSSNLAVNYILIALGIYAVILILNYVGFYSYLLYLVVGIIIWYLFLKAGIHPTIAGVMMAFSIPANKRISRITFFKEMQKELENFVGIKNQKLLTKQQVQSINQSEELIYYIQPPLQHVENKLHGAVAFFIIPVFALANAGVSFQDVMSGGTGFSVLSMNITLAMILGKIIGISLFSWIGIKIGWASLPEGSSFNHILGVSVLGGLGFTMALFISNLAYTDPDLLNQSKIGIIIGSLITGMMGYFILLRLGKNGKSTQK